MNSIMKRRSIRKFQDRPVEPDKIERILRAAMQAPSSKDSRPWEFIVVTDAGTKKILSETDPFSISAANAPVLIVPLVNLDRCRGEEDWWVEDLAAATENMMIQIEEEGLGGTWLGIYPLPERVSHVANHFHLPERIIPFCIVEFGYKLREKPFDDRYEPERVHWEKYE